MKKHIKFMRGRDTMKIQWTLIIALIFALFTAVFAVLNVNLVRVNYLFGESDIPLVIIILSSCLLGGLIVGMFGIIRQYRLQKQIRHLKEQLEKASNPTLQEQLDSTAKTAEIDEQPEKSKKPPTLQ